MSSCHDVFMIYHLNYLQLVSMGSLLLVIIEHDQVIGHNNIVRLLYPSNIINSCQPFFSQLRTRTRKAAAISSNHLSCQCVSSLGCRVRVRVRVRCWQQYILRRKSAHIMKTRKKSGFEYDVLCIYIYICICTPGNRMLLALCVRYRRGFDLAGQMVAC